jgi:hypothetical protein
VPRPDDDFLARTEPFAEPRRGGLEHGASGYAEGLRRPRAERRASRQDKRREAMHKPYAVAAGVMGTAVVAAAAFAVLVFAGCVRPIAGSGRRPPHGDSREATVQHHRRSALAQHHHSAVIARHHPRAALVPRLLLG